MVNHFTERCSCGITLSTCRCPSPEKELIISNKPCTHNTTQPEPEYVNSFKKPVYSVTHLHVKKITNGYDQYEVQINDQYFQMSEKQLEALESVTRLPEGVGLSMG